MIENFIITYITDYNPYLMEEATAVFNQDGTFNRLKIEEEEYRSLEVKEAQKRAKAHIKEQKGISYKNILTSNTILIDDKLQMSIYIHVILDGKSRISNT